MNAKVRHVLSDGLLVSFLTFFNGTIDCFHLHQVCPRSTTCPGLCDGVRELCMTITLSESTYMAHDAGSSHVHLCCMGLHCIKQLVAVSGRALSMCNRLSFFSRNAAMQAKSAMLDRACLLRTVRRHSVRGRGCACAS